MKPQKLTITAFGPYLKTQVVDFTTFYNDGLFLLTGDTGAGKSTILDAMVVALFNELPGSRSDAVIKDPLGLTFNVRPAGASDSDRTEIVFEFILGSDSYRITREPKNVTAGGATRAHKASVEELIGGTWTPIASTLGDVDKWVSSTLGMTAEQFAQLVVLPQGKFDKFLRTTSAERESILASLFPVDQYKKIEDWFTRGRKAAAKASDEAAAVLTTAVDRAREVMGDRSDDYDRGTVTAAIADAIAATASLREDSAPKVAAATKAVEAAIAKRDKARDASQALTDFNAAVAEIAQADKIEAEVAAIINDASVTAPYSTRIPALIENLKTDVAAIDGSLTAIGEIDELEKRVAGLTQESLDLEAKAKAEAEAATGITGELKSAKALAKKLDKAPALQAQAETALTAARKRAKDNDAAIEAAKKLTAAEGKVDAARTQLADCTAAVAAIEKALRDDAAAALAATLVPGHACPVCGSDEHPAPAIATAESANEEQLDAARQAASTAQANLTKATAEVAGHTATLQSKLDELGVTEALDTDALEESVAAAVATLEQAVAQAEELETARQSVDDLEGHLAAAQANVDAAKNALAATRTELLGAQTSLDERRKTVTAAGTVDELTLRRTDATARIEALGKAQEASSKAETARITAQEKRRSNEALAKAAVADLAPLEDAVAAAQATLTDVKQAIADATARGTRLTELQDEIAGASSDAQAADEDLANWERIAKLVEGNTGLKIPLLRYYLARRLKQVTGEASKNLLHMTGGRYNLIHDETAKGTSGRTEGLAVMVLDGWDGSIRTPETLSGGEGFMASLSLALALSEIVSRETGGRKLGALFIDEGFGSLDDETLNQVMDILDGLREGGRLVGVISHVTSMKARIPAQLVVKRGKGGSTISTRVDENAEMSA